MAAFGTNIDGVRVANLSMTYNDNLGCNPEDFVQIANRADADSHRDHTIPQTPLDWILLRRGECPFIDKVRNAQIAGFEGVIVGDDGSSYDSLLTMFAKSSDDVSIPSLFITHQSYLVLREAADGSDFMALQIDSAEMRTDWPLLDTLIFICFSPLCTLLIVYIVLFFRRRRIHLDNILPPAYLSKLEVVEYMAKDGVNAECVICLENFQAEEKLLELPCKHLYHEECIRKWLIERKKICPICKRDVSVGIDVREGRIDESAISSTQDNSGGPIPRSSVLAEQVVDEETPLLRSAATQTHSAALEASSLPDDEISTELNPDERVQAQSSSILTPNANDVAK